MSSNQKQTSIGGPQTQRYTSSPYQPIQGEGNRPDGYPVSTPPGTYVQSQQPNQGGNQGPGLRGITPTGPPNQASTPPNAEIKVQAIQQQPLNHMFVQQQVRPTQGTYYRSNGPPNQAQRMPNHNNRPPQALYTPGPTQYVHVPQMYITPNTLPYPAGYPTQRQPGGFVQTIPTQMFPHITSATPFNHHYTSTPTQNQQVQYNYYQPVMQPARGSIPQVPPMNPNPPQNPIANVPLVPTNPPHQPFQRQPPKRRPNAISIIDPDTGADRLQELFEDSSSHPPSGDSSARQTPQPQPHNHNKEVQAAFAKQVMQAINKDVADPSHIEDSDIGSDLGIHVEPPPFVVAPSPLPPTVPLSKFEHVVQSSKLQAGAKEFVLSSNTAKETPIVSANCDSIEVTLLPNKLPKDRESPVKGARKPRDQQQLPPLPQQQPHQQHQPLQQQQQPLQQQQQQPLQQQQQPLQQPQLQQPVPQQPREHRDSVKESVLVRDEASSIVNDEVKSAPEPTPVPIVAPASLPPQLPSAPVKENQVPEKRAQKKETKAEPKLTSGDRIETAPVSIPAPVPVPVQQLPIVALQAQDSTNAKSKQNAHRSAASKQQQQQQQQQQQLQQQQAVAQNNNHKQPVAVATPVPTPQPQPAKPAGGKAHKKNELNQKGANKEGTDMDAFNDNAGKEEVNSNVTPVHLDNDIINANSLPAETTNIAAQPAPVPTPDINVNVPAAAPVTESDEVTISRPVVSEPTKPVKASTNFDITSIVKDVPRDIKFISKVESQDETDRAAASANERLAPVKNNAGSKNDISRVDNKLPYQEGQWSPANQDGLKKYQMEFLKALQNSPASQKAPENILEAVLADDRGRLGDGRSSMGGGRSTDFAPSFNNYGKSNSRGAPPKRNSQSKMGPGGKLKAPIKVSISVREDVKLHETENAWKPARLIKGENATSEDKKTEELYKKVRGVLNKLTPQKFDTLLAQIKALQIDTTERLQGVIDLCFDKAVDEPNYSVAYALMCRELALMQVPSSTSTEEKPDYVNFRKLLVTRCQVEFEKQSVDESSRNLIVKELEKANDPERTKELQFDLEEHDRKLRMKSVGNIRFIGELFKQKMLTVNIMMRCLNILLDHRDEESLECLCKLMTTIGKELESSNVSLSSIFSTLKNIADHKKDIKVSSRIRFMIQDVIDLRHSKWVPRRQDLNPKTIDQITKEAEHEHMNIQMMNSGPMMPRKDDRSNHGGQNNDRKDRRGGRNVAEDGGWTTMNTNRTRQQFTVQSEKLKSIAPNSNEPLGSPMMFGTWGKGSVGSNNKGPPSTNTANMYAPLENIEMEKRNINIRIGNKDPYHSKGPSLERNYNKYDGRGSRSGSQHRSNDSSASSSQRSTPAPMLPPPAMPKPVAQPAPAPVEAPKMTEDQILRRITNSLEEYVRGNCTLDDYFMEISDIPASFMPRIVSESYSYILEKSQQLRLKTGSLFATSLKQNKILLKDYSSGLKEILSQADDLKIDIPKIWDYLAELLVDVVCEEAIPLDELCACSLDLINQRQAHQLMAPLFKLVIAKKGENFLSSIWKKSELQLADLVGNEADSFVVDNHFEFLTGGSTPAGKKLSTFEEMKDELCNVLESNNDVNSIKEWISSNIGEGVKENMFVRALATAIFTLSIDDKSKLIVNKLTYFLSLIHVYVDNENNREMQCLYALQTLIHKMEHPQGLLFQICNNLYELGFISEESFVAWELDKDPAEQEGKGVALKQLTSFFTQLKENYDEFSGSGAED